MGEDGRLYSRAQELSSDVEELRIQSDHVEDEAVILVMGSK